jgi:hypothetical protein
VATLNGGQGGGSAASGGVASGRAPTLARPPISRVRVSQLKCASSVAHLAAHRYQDLPDDFGLLLCFKSRYHLTVGKDLTSLGYQQPLGDE